MTEMAAQDGILVVDLDGKLVRIPNIGDLDYSALKSYGEQGFRVLGDYADLLNPGMIANRRNYLHRTAVA